MGGCVPPKRFWHPCNLSIALLGPWFGETAFEISLSPRALSQGALSLNDDLPRSRPPGLGIFRITALPRAASGGLSAFNLAIFYQSAGHNFNGGELIYLSARHRL